MPFIPKYSHEEVERMIAGGGLSAFEVYRLKHQHPLNRLTHFIGIPVLVVSIVYPLFAWFAWGFLAWKAWMILTAAGWGLQFLGHAIEGNQPAFFRDPRHLIVGPLYFLGLPLLRLRARDADRPSSSGAGQESPLTPKPKDRHL
jgi:uncharacterized membrane protein YGL010W